MCITCSRGQMEAGFTESRRPAARAGGCYTKGTKPPGIPGAKGPPSSEIPDETDNVI